MRIGNEKTLQLFTIGHSNRSFEEFLSLLKAFEIRVVADIRRYPSSRKFPHFNHKELLQLLNRQNIRYIWMEALGGRRHAGKNDKSPNTGIKSPGFRNYADHMTGTPQGGNPSDKFRAAVQELLSIAAGAQTAIMCAEKLYWKCHRRLLSDYLIAKAVKVKHILEPGRASEHKLTPYAVISDDGIVTYPPPTTDLMDGKTLFEP